MRNYDSTASKALLHNTQKYAKITSMKSLLAIMMLFLSSEAFGQDQNADSLLTKVQSFYEKTTDYKASFRQVVTTKSPKRTFTRTGVVYFKRPGMMRWDYKVPDEVYYVSDGETLWVYEVEEGVVYRMPVRNSEAYEALRFLVGTAHLTRDFEVQAQPANERGLVPLLLKPKVTSHLYRTVTLFVDPETGETKETEVVDPTGNVSHVRFEKASFATLPLEGFKFRPPEGVPIQDIGYEERK